MKFNDGNKSFETWLCTYATVEGGGEIFRQRRINVVYGQTPPNRMQSNGNIYILSDANPADLTAWYDASHVVAGLTYEECEARRVARRLIGVK